ncbi:MAG: Ig-like domain repeat protein, partial [Candidatus Saganbacteria bacterium]|nr:Ig-like domain repeat protein [Candidatus Saganbacteria bacterium]
MESDYYAHVNRLLKEYDLIEKAVLDSRGITTIQDMQTTIEATRLATEEVHTFSEAMPSKGLYSIKIRSFQERRDEKATVHPVPITIDSDRKYVSTLLVTQIPEKIKCKLNYLIPHKLKQFQYSFNFAAWKDIDMKLVNTETGEFIFEGLPFAEGQNLLAIRSTNAADISCNQLIKIILNTIPMVASNFYPIQNYYTSNVFQRIGVEFNKSGYTGDSSEGINIVSFKLDGNELLPQATVVTTQETYKASAGIEYTPKDPLPDGQHDILVQAQSNVGVSQAIWSFYVDTQAPTITIEAVAPYSPRAPAFAEASAGKPDKPLVIHYTTSDNFSTFLKSGTARIYDSKGNFVTEIATFETQANGDNYIEWDGRNRDVQSQVPPFVEDGIYTLKIKAFDEAGNYAIAEIPIEIDSTPPAIYEADVSPNPMTSNQKTLNFGCRTTEDSIVMLRLINRETKNAIGYAAQAKALREGDEPKANYSWNYGDSSYGAPEDGLYDLEITAQDKAGNISAPTTVEAIRIDRTPPVIFAHHTDPYVLSNTGSTPYTTTLYYQLSEENDKAVNRAGPRSSFSGSAVKVKVKLYNENTGELLWVRDDRPNSLTEANKVTWDASSTKFGKGAYKFQIVAEDKYGNISEAFATTVKDGIAPIISFPFNDQEVSGTIAIRGVAMDPDWTNPFGFKDYRIYIAKGTRGIPSDLGSLDPIVYQDKFIEVPTINRTDTSARNVSLRPLQQDSTLAYLYTNGLENGEYTLLLVVDEESPGTSVASVRTINIKNDPSSTAINYPVIKLGEIPKEIEFKSDGSVTLPINFINSVKPANVHIEIIKQLNNDTMANEGVVYYKYLPNIPGAIYTGKPDYKPGTNLGYFIWMDGDGWHVRWSSDGNNHHFTGSLMAAGEISNLKTVNWNYTSTGSPFITWNVTLSGSEGGFDFDTNATQLIFIPKIDEDPNTPTFSASNVYVGLTKYQFQFLPIMLTPTPYSLTPTVWDGKLDTGAFADNGKYIVRIRAEGVDGNGLSTDEAVVSIKTPFELKDIQVENPKFDPVGAPDRVSIFYNLSKDALVSAKVYRAGWGGGLVSTLTEEAYVPGNLNSDRKLSISWRGNYPNAGGTQTVSFGDYYIVLKASAVDGSDSKETKIEGINIKGATGASLAVLDDIGELKRFNGGMERIAEGSSPYYFEAVGSGRYYPPKEFSYTLNAKGSQWAKTYPYVPYALLAHRYFKKVKTNIDASFVGNIRRIWYPVNTHDDDETLIKHDISSLQKTFTDIDTSEAFSGTLKADELIAVKGPDCQRAFKTAGLKFDVYSLTGSSPEGNPFILDT